MTSRTVRIPVSRSRTRPSDEDVPDGYVSLPAALDHHGRALYGDAWTGAEAAARDSAARSWDISAAIHARHPNPSSELDDDYLPVGDLDLPEPDPAELAELEERHAAERQARARWEAAYLDLRRKMQSGEIAAVYRRAHDNALIDLSVADWSAMGESAFRTGIARIGNGRGRIFVELHIEDVAHRPRPSDRRKVSPAALRRFLMTYADGNKKQDECRDAAEKYFGTPIPDRNVWRPVWTALPAEKKLGPGQRPRKKE